MATNTTNYNWTKPDYEDDADIKDLNDNFDGIDAQIKAIDDQVQLNKNNILTLEQANADLTEITQIIDITSEVVALSGFTKKSGTHVYKQGKHIFGTLIFQKDSGDFPATGANTIGSLGVYSPKSQWLGGGFFSNDMWKVQSYGYAFIQAADGTAQAGYIVVTDNAGGTNNIVKIQIDYVMP